MDISPAKRVCHYLLCALSSGAYPDIFIELLYVIFDLQLYFFHFLFLLMYVDSFQSHNNIALH